MAARGITLRWEVDRDYQSRQPAVRVRVSVDETSGDMPAEIFAYRRLPASPRSGETSDYYSHVCSPPDIADFPANDVIPGLQPEWFRRDYVDVLVRTVSEAEDLVLIARADTARLKTTLDVMDTLGDVSEEVLLAPSTRWDTNLVVPSPVGITAECSSSRYNWKRHDGIRVRVDITETAGGLPTELFAYRALPRDPSVGSTAGHFSHICSPADIAAFPAEEPTAGVQPAWFRLSYVDVWVRSEEESDDLVSTIMFDLNQLRHDTTLMDDLTLRHREAFGAMNPPEIEGMLPLQRSDGSYILDAAGEYIYEPIP